jgi:hypothetical protein
MGLLVVGCCCGVERESGKVVKKELFIFEREKIIYKPNGEINKENDVLYVKNKFVNIEKKRRRYFSYNLTQITTQYSVYTYIRYFHNQIFKPMHNVYKSNRMS